LKILQRIQNCLILSNLRKNIEDSPKNSKLFDSSNLRLKVDVKNSFKCNTLNFQIIGKKTSEIEFYVYVYEIKKESSLYLFSLLM